MTACTVVKYDNPVPGFVSGTTANAQNGYTLDTGLGREVAFFALATTDDTIVTVTSQSGGIVTLGLYVAGVAVSSDEVLTWWAVRQSR